MSDYTRALITGASSGIGTAIAREYALRGVDLARDRRGHLEVLLRGLGETLASRFPSRGPCKGDLK